MAAFEIHVQNQRQSNPQNHMQSHGYCNKNGGKLNGSDDLGILKHIYIIGKSHKLINSRQNLDIKQTVFNSYQNRIKSSKPAKKYYRKNQKPWYPFH